jgi:hypothetical protein
MNYSIEPDLRLQESVQLRGEGGALLLEKMKIMSKNKNILTGQSIVIFVLMLLSCRTSSNRTAENTKKDYIPIEAKISFWNVFDVKVSLLLNGTLFYSRPNISTVSLNHAFDAVLFYKHEGEMFADGDTTIMVPDKFILTTRINDFERNDTIEMKEIKTVLISYGQENEQGYILVDKLKYLMQSK